ncbi:MAG: hypoxanthine phosphoribosyltransferase [Prevotella sp.]|nr:hypoxanthine phosphoribosyltransferase [Prevotella sp.]MDD7045729.1 hypoxanthine phosphoribosyltransferase [Prevotella sp.]MDY5547396.1 hypoxanthine phosphoribosyltransferase [Prevotella sp.]
MSRVKIKDKTFETSIPEAEILKRIQAVADRINKDMEGKTPIFLAVLNGSFMFAADLMKMVTIPCEISFVKLASYEGTSSTGKIKKMIGINTDLTGRNVIIVEDIVESGLTMQNMLDQLKEHNPASVSICTLLLKPEKLTVDLDIDYTVMEIPNDFIVGYGLDYDQQGRNLRDIYTLVSE